MQTHILIRKSFFLASDQNLRISRTETEIQILSQDQLGISCFIKKKYYHVNDVVKGEDIGG